MVMPQSYRMLMVAAMMLGLTLGLGAHASAAPSSSLAQYKPTGAAALAHFEAGNRAYKDARIASRPLADRVRDLKHAIDEYTAGQALDDAPAFDYNIAHAARLLVDNATAVAHLQRFVERTQPDAQLRNAVENEITELDPSGAIRANLRQAKAPAVESKPPPALPPAAPPPSAAPGASQPVTSGPVLATSAPAAPRESRVWGRLGWGLTAAGVVGAGVTTWLMINASGLDNDSKDTSRTMSDRLDLQHQADSRRHAALIVGIGSGAAVVLGIVTLALPARADARATGSAWNLGITGHGVAVFGRF
jgi:hypothetical protein